jgi:hypothetical protein
MFVVAVAVDPAVIHLPMAVLAVGILRHFINQLDMVHLDISVVVVAAAPGGVWLVEQVILVEQVEAVL